MRIFSTLQVMFKASLGVILKHYIETILKTGEERRGRQSPPRIKFSVASWSVYFSVYRNQHVTKEAGIFA